MQDFNTLRFVRPLPGRSEVADVFGSYREYVSDEFGDLLMTSDGRAFRVPGSDAEPVEIPVEDAADACCRAGWPPAHWPAPLRAALPDGGKGWRPPLGLRTGP